MKTLITRISFVLFLMTIVFNIDAQLVLPDIISDNMVLQQRSNVAIWGKDNPGTEIVISSGWDEETETFTNETGFWLTRLKTPEAGGPYSITIKGSNEISLKNVMIGEVWICSGQSNMEMPLKGYRNQPVYGGNKAILSAANENIRFFTVKKNARLEPVDEISGQWAESNPATAAEFSAVGYFFGQLINETLNVPVGLIGSHWGGSKVQAWIDEPTLLEYGNTDIPDEIFERKQHTPTVLFNGMINPIIPYGIKGAIWYQGESNVNEPEVYQKLFPAMVDNWRELWDLGDFPFYYVQIAPYRYWGRDAALFREVQSEVMENIENSGMVVTLDVGDCKSIHPPKKKEIGVRLAYWALGDTYHIEGIGYKGPAYSDMEIQGDTLIALQFEHAPMGLHAFGNQLKSFTIAGKDKVFYPANASIIRDKADQYKSKVLVWSEEVPSPVAVRYAWENCPKGGLYNTYKIPASSFRTDDW